MGNKCFKTNKIASTEANSVPKSRRWRLFRALGLGKFCAKVDVQQEEIKNESHEDIGVQTSITEWITADLESFNTAISLISMLDNETGDGIQDELNETMTIYSEDVEKINIDQNAVITNRAFLTTVSDKNIDSIAEEGQVSAEEKDVDARAELQIGSDIRQTKTDIQEMLYVAKADFVKEMVSETQEKSTTAIEKDLSTDITTERRVPTVVMTSSDTSSSSDDGILQRRPLSPEFFSTTDNKPYEEFEGEVEEEIEECIEIEEEKEGYAEMDIATAEHSALESKKAVRKAGKGEVCLAEEDVKAAILRLAFFREGKDSSIDCIDINKATEVSPKAPYLDATMESNLRKDHPSAETAINTEEVNVVLERKNSDYDRALDFPADYGQQTLRADKQDHAKEIKEMKYANGPERCEPCTSNGIAGLSVPHEERKTASLQNIWANIDKTLSYKSVSASDGNMQGSTDLDKNVVQETSGKTYKVKEVSDSISLAIALSLEAIKNHDSRCDCVMSFYVRSPQFGQEPRKIEVRASAKQVKDGSAEKHIKLLKNIQMPAKPVCPVPVTPNRSKKHLFTVPALAEHDATNVNRWIQKQGPPDLAKTSSVPTFYETTEKTLNPREKLGLEKLQKFKIGLQCKQIERIKIDAEEFPGILPPKIREKWRKKMDKKKHIN